MLNKNERDGAITQIKGKAKQVAGTLTGNNGLKDQGQVDETIGKVESAVGRNKHQLGDAITRIGAAVKKG